MATTIKSGAGVSRYLRLYRVLSQSLAEGRFGDGKPLPSEPRLMREYGISRSTVRRALGRLEAEGRIERKRGSGTYAREGKGEAAAAPTDLSPLLDGAATPPAAVTGRTIAFQRVPTPAPLVSQHPEFGAAALLIRQVRYAGRDPIVMETAHLPEAVASGLTRRSLDGDGRGILTMLAAIGHRGTSLEREFVALEADPLAAESLGMAVGAPVLNVRTLARDPRDRIVAYVSCFYRPDRYEAHATIQLSPPKTLRTASRG